MSLIRKSKRLLICIFVPTLLLCACKSADTESGNPSEKTPDAPDVASVGTELSLSIDGETVDVAWEDNAAVDDLKALVSGQEYEIDLSQYGDFEQVGSIGKSLTSNDEQITTEPGDIVLYSGDQMVVFYGSNSWAYTRLGRIKDKSPEELEDLLGKSNVAIRLSME